MGGFGAEQIVQTVVGVGGTAASIYAANSQAGALNDMMAQGRGTTAQQEGLAQYFLGGGKASKLDVPMFQDQFGEIDYALQEQERLIDKQGRTAQDMIAQNIPPGGAKLRALANLAISTQDAKSKAVRESQSRKRELDVKLTNQYAQQAMGAKYGPSQDARLWAVQKDYDNRVKNYGAISGALGDMTGRMFAGQEKPQVGYTDPNAAGGTPLPLSMQTGATAEPPQDMFPRQTPVTPPGYTWSGPEVKDNDYNKWLQKPK